MKMDRTGAVRRSVVPDFHGSVLMDADNNENGDHQLLDPTYGSPVVESSSPLMYPKKWEHRKSLRPQSSTQIDEVNKKWFRFSYKCDLSQLQKLFKSDSTLVNARDFATGYAAIHWAAKYGRSDVITWLNENDADVNIRTYGGHSPLHIATMHNNKDIVKTLITQFNADVNVRDYSGHKPGFYLLQTATVASPTNPVPYFGPSGRHLFTPQMNISRHSMPNSMTMPDLSEELQTIAAAVPKKKKKGMISLSNSFKGKRKFLVVKRGEGASNGESAGSGGTIGSPSTGKRLPWRKSLSVPDISQISEPVVVFEEEF